MALNNTPLPGQDLNQTRTPINENFATIDTAFSVDHVGYNNPNQGFHNKTTLPVQSVAPTPVASATLLYSRTSTITSQPELVFAHQSGSTAPSTAQVVEFTSAGWANPGWCRLPSGILMKWGTLSCPTSGAINTVSFPVGSTIPTFSAIYSCQVTNADATTEPTATFSVGTLTTTTVDVYASSGTTVAFNFFAIGV